MPYTSIVGCSGPANDVWYKFTATGTLLDIKITSAALSSPNVSLYEGSNCASFLNLACLTGSGGSLNQTFQPLVVGSTYYIQVSGGSVGDVGAFTLTLENDFQCATCLLGANLIATPPPVNGTYGPNQTITFCYTVSDYSQVSVNWLHGVIPSFGNGWNLASLTPTVIPPSCDQDPLNQPESWDFYNSVTSWNTGQTWGPGFFYESPLGSPFGVSDNDPGDNFGDQSVGAACQPTFCWTIKTKANCSSGTNLSVSVRTTGDYLSGSYGSAGCLNDPVSTLAATLICCNPTAPVMSSVSSNCGLANGSVTATGTGTGPWQYIWANSSGTILSNVNNINGANTLSNLASGNYNVTVIDATNCSITASATVGSSAPPSITASNTGPYCAGQTISLTSTAGGTSYSWNATGYTANTQSPTRTNSTTAMGGTYTVTVTFAGGCTASATTTVVVNAALAAAITPANPAICVGQSVTLTASGGTSYNWSNLANTAANTVSPTINTLYTVTVTNANTCTATANVTVTVHPNPTASINPATVNICLGLNATLTAIGGATYAWSNLATLATISVNPATSTTYTVTATDINNCTATASRLVNVYTPPTVSIAPLNPSICQGSSVTLTATGATSYVWSNTSTNTSINVSPNLNTTYNVTGTDNNGCTATASSSVTVNAIPAVVINPALTAICLGSSTTLTATGGISYVWNTTATTNTLNVSPAINTNYSVTATDANNCTGSATATVTVNSLPAAAITPSPVSICLGNNITLTASGGPIYSWSTTANTNSITVSPSTTTAYSVTVTSAATCTASASVSVTVNLLPTPAITPASSTICLGNNVTLNANGAVSYAWSNAASGNSISVSPGTNTTYTVTATDANGCSATATAIVNVAAAVTLSTTVTNVLCNGGNTGSVSLNITNGQTPFTFVWSNSANTQNISGLTANTYTVQFSDNVGCTATASATVSEPTLLQVSETHVNVTCNGLNNGSINITTTGGTPNYTYSWNDGNTAANRSSLSPGSYSVTIYDNNQCSASISVLITEPTVLNISETLVDEKCNGDQIGQIQITTSGGASPYSYLWNDAATSQNRTGLAAGNYSLTITDFNNCTATIAATINEPAALTLSETHTNVQCFGVNIGSITINAAGGTTPYSYLWNDGITSQNRLNLGGGSYTLVATDLNQCTASISVQISTPALLFVTESHSDENCNGDATAFINANVGGGTTPYTYIWNDANSSQNRTALTAGTYSVTVTDNNQCTVSVSATINQPQPLVVSSAITNVSCLGGSNGSIALNVTGGTAPFNFIWSDGETNSSINSKPAGTYTATVTDANFCNITTTATINDGSFITIRTTQINASCFGTSTGSITLNIAGGALPYVFNWSNQASTQNQTNLAAGSYSVTVSDNNGCSTTATANVLQPPAIVISNPNIDNVTCFGGSDGNASVSVSGGAGTFTYTWNGVAGNNPQDNLSANTYIIVATDANQCTASSIVTITQPTVLTSSAASTDALCHNGADGTATDVATGGTPPYSYLWNNQKTISNISGLTANIYTCTVTDNNGCTTTASTTINEPGPLTFSLSTTGVKCVGDKNGTITASPNGGVPPYNYSATQDFTNFNYVTNGAVEGLDTGLYYVVLTDNNGCTKTDTISVPNAYNDEYTVTTDSTTCFGPQYNDGAIHITGNPAFNQPFQYSVDSSQFQYSGDFTQLDPGLHNIVGMNQFGCKTELQAPVYEPALGVTNIYPSDTTINLGEQIQLSSVFGPFDASTIKSYNWTPAEGLSCIDCSDPVVSSYAEINNYTLTITYNQGCIATATSKVIVLGTPPVFIPNSFSPNGDGNNDKFYVYGESIKTVDLKIFNRWGEKVFDSNNQFLGWDGTFKGTIQNPGVFVYEAKITFLNDATTTKTGSVTIIR